MNWIKIENQNVDFAIPHLLAVGDSVFIRGSYMQPFLYQIAGEVKSPSKIEFTHWMPIKAPE